MEYGATHVNGLFGKLPSRADFVRINVTGEALEFAAYLENAVNTCRRAGCEVPEAGAFFLYRAIGAPGALVGLLKASSDKVGRTFPLALFTTLETSVAAGDFDFVPWVYASFFTEAAALAAEAAELDPASLEEQLAALPVPSGEDFQAAQEHADTLLAATTALQFNEALFGPASEGRQYFAYHTFASACEQSRELVADTKPGITLDLPVLEEQQMIVWLGAVRRLLGEQAVPPALLWTPPRPSPSYGSIKLELPPTPGRLLVGFGAPSPSALAYLAGAMGHSPKLWPVTCNDPSTIARVRTSLRAEQLEVLVDPEASVEAVLAAFGG